MNELRATERAVEGDLLIVRKGDKVAERVVPAGCTDLNPLLKECVDELGAGPDEQLTITLPKDSTVGRRLVAEREMGKRIDQDRFLMLEKPWLSPRRRQPVTGKHVGRNEPCPCGSGKKYKKCCLNPGAKYVQEPAVPATRAPLQGGPGVARPVDELPVQPAQDAQRA